MRPNGGVLAPNEIIIATGNAETIIPVSRALLQKGSITRISENTSYLFGKRDDL